MLLKWLNFHLKRAGYKKTVTNFSSDLKSFAIFFALPLSYRNILNPVVVLCRNGLSTDCRKISFAEMMPDDVLVSREERAFRLWINSLGITTYVNNVFEDVRNG
ncbi:hypothetical protein BHM03_00021671 [Ensete ventricosum]|nr:hypothetical protein BHM03_00021671 [Ensete ventricosum]